MPDEFTPEEEQILRESPADSPNLLEGEAEAGDEGEAGEAGEAPAGEAGPA